MRNAACSVSPFCKTLIRGPKLFESQIRMRKTVTVRPDAGQAPVIELAWNCAIVGNTRVGKYKKRNNTETTPDTTQNGTEVHVGTQLAKQTVCQKKIGSNFFLPNAKSHQWKLWNETNQKKINKRKHKNSSNEKDLFLNCVFGKWMKHCHFFKYTELQAPSNET